MKLFNAIKLFGIVLIFLTSCDKKYDEYAENPNRAESVPPSLTFTAIANDLNIDRPWSSVTRWAQFDAVNYNYYGDQRYDWTGSGWNFITLNNIERMEGEAKKIGLPDVNPYSALAKFFKAFFIIG